MDDNRVTIRQRLEAQLIDRAMKDAAFREELVRDPKGVFAANWASGSQKTSTRACWKNARPRCTSSCRRHLPVRARSCRIPNSKPSPAAAGRRPPSVTASKLTIAFGDVI